MVGALDHTMLPEASGLAASRQYPDRLYHVNDSGDGPFFYLTDLRGKHTRRVRISGFEANGADVEDISLGPCPGQRTCLFIGDIGDNLRLRPTLEILVIVEKPQYDGPVVPRYRLRLAYPDHPHDAEAMAVHANGDVYILTKEQTTSRPRRALPARLYRVKRRQWEQRPDQTHTLSLVGEIDLPALLPSPRGWDGRLATALDIAPDGSTLVVLTYADALEFALDLATAELPPTSRLRAGLDYQRIALRHLPQQEGTAYFSHPSYGKSLLYHTEFRRGRADLLRLDCQD